MEQRDIGTGPMECPGAAAGPNLLFDMLGGVSISMQRQGGVRASVAEGGDAMAREPLLDMRMHPAGRRRLREDWSHGGHYRINAVE